MLDMCRLCIRYYIYSFVHVLYVFVWVTFFPYCVVPILLHFIFVSVYRRSYSDWLYISRY